MSTNRRTIGRLAKEVGVSVETVRYYERRGLMEQPRALGAAKWRVYPDRALWILRYVKIAQDLGFSLAEVAELLKVASVAPPAFCLNIRAAVSRKLDQVDRDLSELQARRIAIVEFLEACAKRNDGPKCPIFMHLNGETE